MRRFVVRMTTRLYLLSWMSCCRVGCPAVGGRGCLCYPMLSRRVLHCAVSQRAFRHKRLQRACLKFTGQVVCRLRSSVWWGLLYFSGSIASFAGLAVQARAAAPTDGAVHQTGLLGSGVHFRLSG